MVRKVENDDGFGFLDEIQPIYVPPAQVKIRASDGTEYEVPENMAGMDTGFAMICNPGFLPQDHPAYDPYSRAKDGNVLIGCEEGEHGALPVADAYQQFHREIFEEVVGYALDGLCEFYGPMDWTEYERSYTPDVRAEASRRYALLKEYGVEREVDIPTSGFKNNPFLGVVDKLKRISTETG